MQTIAKRFGLMLTLFCLLLAQNVHAYYDPTAGHFISFDPVLPPAGSMDGYSFGDGDPVNRFDADGRLGKGFYSGLMDASVPANASSAFMAGYTSGGVSGSYYGTLFNEGEAAVSPSTYINGTESFGNNINTVYQSDGFLAAGSYVTTSWNVGAVWSGAANINLATGQPVGDGVDRAEDILNGIAGTAGVASGGVSAFNWATAPAATAPIVVNAQTIQTALEGSTAQTAQGSVSIPVVEAYVRQLEAGSPAPPITMDGNVIIDGNHRYIAGQIFGTEPPVNPGTLSPSQAGQVQPIQQIKLDPVDWGNR